MKKCIRLGKLCNDNKSRQVKMNQVTINFKTIPSYIEELNRILERKEIIRAQRLLIRPNSHEKETKHSIEQLSRNKNGSSKECSVHLPTICNSTYYPKQLKKNLSFCKYKNTMNASFYLKRNRSPTSIKC